MKAFNLHLALFAATLFSLSAAQAQTFYVVKAGLERGDSPVTVTEPSGGSRVTNIGLSVSAERSYCCEARISSGGSSTNTLDQAVFTTLSTTAATTTTVTPVSRGFSEPFIPAFNGFSDSTASRKCFISPNADNYTLGMNIGADNGIAITSVVDCTETTLFGGYNTSVSQYNFLEISNTLVNTGDDITVRIDARNSVTGTTVISGQLRVVPAASRVDVDLHSIVGSGAFGPLTISHDGPPGSIRAAVAQYRVTGTSPQTSVPVAREELTTRGRN